MIAKSTDLSPAAIQKRGSHSSSFPDANSTQSHNSGFQTHVVKPKETLFSISRQYGVQVSQIRELNGISGNHIGVGQTIKVGVSVVDKVPENVTDTLGSPENNSHNAIFTFSNVDASQNARFLPPSINSVAYEKTVQNLTNLLNRNDSNFVIQLLNNDSTNRTNYSLKVISSIKAERVGSSDFVKLTFSANDPGICQQVLIFFTEVCIKNYKNIKENRSDAVVKYFEYQVKQATQRLKTGEDKLLAFNQEKNIINYYEQSKAVEVAKEALDVDYNNMKIKLAGTEAAIKRLEDKLEKQKIIQLKSGPILEKRNQLNLINTKIATAEVFGNGNTVNVQDLSLLKAEAEKIKDEMHDAVTELYRFNNTTESLPISSLLNDWISQVISFEETKAGLVVLGKRIQDFQKQYEIYAPAGSNLKRIEREISVSEQEFLELLHGLNLAKLKMQDIELSSNLKAIDEPYYPITANPSKRKFLIIGAALFGFLIVLSAIMALEYFDETLRNPKKAAKILNLSPLGIFPKIYLKPEVLNFPFVTNRLLEIAAQRIEFLKKARIEPGSPFQVLLFSTVNNEGKTITTQNLAIQLKKLGNKVVVIKYVIDQTSDNTNRNFSEESKISSKDQIPKTVKFSFLQWLLGYSDRRVDYQSPYICDNFDNFSENELFEYKINDEFHLSANYEDLLTKSGHSLAFKPDFVLIKIPPILYFPYPPAIVASADLPLMVCRANRVWSEADQSAIENFSKLTSNPPQFLLNGVELDVVESVMGELQKKRSWFRKIIKKIVRFQFVSSNIP